MRSLDGKRVLVTGAARGIGRTLAERFAHNGAEVILTDLDETLLADARDAIRAAGASATTCTLDVASRDSIRQARTRIDEQGGPIDVLVNNAGIVAGGAFGDVPWEQHEQTYRVNTLGLVATTHAFLPDLVQQPTAHIVNIASASGLIGLPFGSTYASSKWAVIGFSESIRLELAESGHGHVKVTTVCPSYVDTGMFSGVRPPLLTPMLTPEKLAAQVVRAVLRERPFVRTPWPVHLVPLLSGILPTAAFDAFARTFGVNTSMRHWRGHDS